MNTIKSFLFIFTIFFSVFTNAENLTESDVQNLLDRIDTAVINLDADAVANTLSENVNITINITAMGQTQVMNPSKQEYISMLDQGWAMYENYKYSKSNVVINITGNTAIASATVHESMTVQGQEISGVTQEEATIEVVDGNLLITKIIGYATM